jgi:uncharacterized protein YgiM (DUF1202 family)
VHGAALVGLVLMLATLAPASVPARAQVDALTVGTLIRVVTADGLPLDMRAGPGLGHPVVIRLASEERVTVIAEPQSDGVTRWVPVQTSSGLLGWIPDQYIGPVTPVTTIVAEAPAPPPSTEPTLAAAQPAITVQADPNAGRPVDVEVKLKFPEAKTRHQEVTIWVSRDGRPIEGAAVTLFIPEDEDQELRTLEPTNSEGRTMREFTLGRKKGTVQMTISAVAPDGGKGQTDASYFVR